MGTNGDLRITSAQLYPATGASATIWGGYETGRRLEILRQPGTESVASPLSVFGSLSLGADTVIQAGTVRAPWARSAWARMPVAATAGARARSS